MMVSIVLLLLFWCFNPRPVLADTICQLHSITGCEKEYSLSHRVLGDDTTADRSRASIFLTRGLGGNADSIYAQTNFCPGGKDKPFPMKAIFKEEHNKNLASILENFLGYGLEDQFKSTDRVVQQKAADALDDAVAKCHIVVDESFFVDGKPDFELIPGLNYSLRRGGANLSSTRREAANSYEKLLVMGDKRVVVERSPHIYVELKDRVTFAALQKTLINKKVSVENCLLINGLRDSSVEGAIKEAKDLKTFQTALRSKEDIAGCLRQNRGKTVVLITHTSGKNTVFEAADATVTLIATDELHRMAGESGVTLIHVACGSFETGAAIGMVPAAVKPLASVQQFIRAIPASNNAFSLISSVTPVTGPIGITSNILNTSAQFGLFVEQDPDKIGIDDLLEGEEPIQMDDKALFLAATIYVVLPA